MTIKQFTGKVAALLLGLIFLMTTKPDMVGSLIVMAIALLLGLASSLLVSLMRRAPRTGDGGPKGAGQRADWLSSGFGEQE